MIPAAAPRGGLSALTRDGEPVAAAARTVKGIEYVVFPAAAGSYVATYGPGAAPLTPEPTHEPSGVVTGPPRPAPAPRTARLLGRRVRASRNGKVKLRVRCPQRRVALPHHAPDPQGPQAADPPPHRQRQARRHQDGHAAPDAQRARPARPRALHEGRRAPRPPARAAARARTRRTRIRLLAPRR